MQRVINKDIQRFEKFDRFNLHPSHGLKANDICVMTEDNCIPSAT